ncbi:MAG: glycine cleavage system protein H, partial [Deltaproteobacteria bacterium]|nr:glycine cleavage system protein H [Deltaproteobacteria bacterium]
TRHAPVRVSLPEAVVDFCCDVTNLATALLGKNFGGTVVTESVIGHSAVVAQSLGMVGELAARGTSRLLKARLEEGLAKDRMAAGDVFAVLAGMAALGHPLAWDDARVVSSWNNKALQAFQKAPEGYLKNAEALLAVAGVDNIRRKGQELAAPSRKVLEETLTRIARRELYGLEVDFTVYYNPGHTWVRPLDAGQFAVGLDDFALRLAGKVDKVVLPEEGTVVKQGETACWVEKGGSRVPVPSPVTGKVVFSNPALVETIGTGQMSDPYENAWLFAVEPERIEQEAPMMLKGNRAVEHLRAEVRSLLAETSGRAVGLDGASLATDLLAGATPTQWADTMKRFLNR